MPLRAQSGGVDVVAPLPDSEWDDLAEKVRTKKVTLTLPCCGEKGFLRRSKYDIQHFVHHRASGCEPESAEHLAAKFLIVKACKALGLVAIPEYCGEGWRADVLVRTPKREACFEVQLSPQSFEETLRRQKAYEASNVRCCWFFRELPRQTRRPFLEREARLIAEMPAFRLSQHSTGHQFEFDVELNGKQRPLSSFVSDLLTRQIRYCRASELKTFQAQVLIWESKCWSCGTPFNAFELLSLNAFAQCGTSIKFELKRSFELLPEVYFPFFSKLVTQFPGIYNFSIIEEEIRYPRPRVAAVFGCGKCHKSKLHGHPEGGAAFVRNNLKFQAQANFKGAFALSHWCDRSGCTSANATTTVQSDNVIPLLGDLDWSMI